MIGTIQVCGRFISRVLLKRLSRRTRSDSAPSRRELVEEFCHATNWFNPKGEPCIGSATVALCRLEEQGEVFLPARRPRAKPSTPRQLRDDGLPLPPLGKVPRRVEQIVGLHLRLIENDRDPAHAIWNRLMARHHPQGKAPLVGSQLRYLIQSESSILGAFGFGPASFHLECRDKWIGWTPEARNLNRSLVIGLSRFLIRPGVSCSNFASCCYGLVLKQVQADWLKRYGVAPVLVETFVDRERHFGRSLAAANWRRLGQSKRRGRDDPKRQYSKTLKDIWVYELDPKARSKLHVQPIQPLPPHSVFAGPLHEDWVQEEMGEVDLGNVRLNQRAKRMLSARWQRPEKSFYRSFQTPAEGKAAYRFVEKKSQHIHLDSLLAVHQQQTARRMSAEKVVLLAQDTTTLSYNSLHQTEGLGPIGDGPGRGLFLHSLLAFRLDGIPLGTLWAELWARPPESDTAKRNEQSIDQKESGRWVRALQQAAQRAPQMPRTRLVVCGDRESDFYELYDQKQALPDNVDLLVRSQHDRCLPDGGRLSARLANAESTGIFQVKVPRRGQRPERTATLQLRWMQIEIKPPAVALKKSWPVLKLYALSAREINAEDQVDPINWTLMTTWPITSVKIAQRLVKWYAIRWGIECWHKVLKVGCGVERRQLKTFQALERTLALDMIVAWRIMLMSRFGKEHPELPAKILYTPAELQVLQILKKKMTCNPSRPRKL